MNVATISGNLVRDIELKYVPSGTAVAKGTLAVKGSYKDKKTGEYPTNFINFIVWSKPAEILCDFTKKGDKLVLSGEIVTGSYDKQDGTKVYTTEINVNSFDLPPKSPNGNQQPTQNEEPFSNDGPGIDEDPDGLPF